MTRNEHRAFQQGMISAAVIVAKTFGRPSIATEILGTAGIRTVEKLKEYGADEYDVAALRESLPAPKTKGGDS